MAPPSTSRAAIAVVVKKKTERKIQRPASAGLPRRKRTARLQTQEPTDNNSHDEEFSFLDQLPSDGLLALDSLLQSTSCITIPLVNIRGVLDCQLNGVDASELATLRRTNQVRVLRPLGLYIRASDYAIAVQSEEWLVKHLPDWTGDVITRDEMEASWKDDPMQEGKVTLDGYLRSLCEKQFLRSSPKDQTYELWLPSWGMVLHAWDKAETNLLRNLQRSHYKERSLTSLQQKHSPIPTTLVVTHLESQGKVERVERPAGVFVKLVLL